MKQFLDNLRGQWCFMIHDSYSWEHYDSGLSPRVPSFTWCEKCQKVTSWTERMGSLEKRISCGWRDLNDREKALMMAATNTQTFRRIT